MCLYQLSQPRPLQFTHSRRQSEATLAETFLSVALYFRKGCLWGLGLWLKLELELGLGLGLGLFAKMHGNVNSCRLERALESPLRPRLPVEGKRN